MTPSPVGPAGARGAAPAIRVVLFDLGGVIAEFRGAAALAELTGAPEAEVWTRWLASPTMRRFESGHCTPEQFAQGIVAEWRLGQTPEQLLDAFAGWLLDPYDGAEQLVHETAQRVTVGCLSNTNAVHWDRVIGHWPLFGTFRHRFLSFELGLIKPERAIFDYVTDMLPVEPWQIAFLDDNPENVEGATSAGITARQVRGPLEARTALEQLGVL